MTDQERRAQRLVAACFAVSTLAGFALLGVYAAGGQTQAEAILLFVSLGGLGIGIVVWSQRLMPNDLVVEERHPLASQPSPEALAATVSAEGAISRRTLLLRMLAAAVAGLGAALAIPVLSLGPAPGRSLFTTPWRAGLHLVDLAGTPIQAADLPLDGVLTAFPEGSPGSPDGQVVLVRVDPALLDLPPGREDWAPDGCLAYSKVCTHAGCAVGLYRAAEHRLLCPCHQSTFDVLTGAIPTYGPAVRPLPQLPIQLRPDGTFVASGDFSGPVGPSFWDIHSDG
jgi:ubiquinol-cytochrome c reductase iron-sulfur subunit